MRIRIHSSSEIASSSDIICVERALGNEWTMGLAIYNAYPTFLGVSLSCYSIPVYIWLTDIYYLIYLAGRFVRLLILHALVLPFLGCFQSSLEGSSISSKTQKQNFIKTILDIDYPPLLIPQNAMHVDFIFNSVYFFNVSISVSGYIKENTDSYRNVSR